MNSNVEKLYSLIAEDYEKKQSLFRMALNNPKSAIDKICEIGNEFDLQVTKDEVIEFLSKLDDDQTKLWLVKVRGGL